MKKLMMTIAAVLCCAMTTTVFTACGNDDDDDDNIKPSVVETPVAVLMDYELETTQATLNILDLTVEYYDADGKIKNEPMKELQWKKSIQHKLPATVGIHLKAQVKDDFIDASNQKRNLPIAESHTTIISTKSKRFSNFLAESNNLLPFLYSFDAKGQYTTGNWE